jgi:hypothetical protein
VTRPDKRIQADSAAVEDQTVRKSFSIGLVAAALLASVVAVLAFWLPSVHASQDRKWQAAGQRALAQVTLPPSFHVYNSVGVRVEACSPSPTARCFVGTEDPQQNVPAVQAAMARVANGPVRSACQAVALPHSPPTCVIQVPVAGSKLVVDLYARAVRHGQHIADLTFDGTYAVVHLTDR